MDCFVALLLAMTKLSSNPRRVCHLLDLLQRLADDRSLEGPQALIDRDQVDDRAPGSDEILEGAPDFRKRTHDLLKRPERDFAGDDCRREPNVRTNDGALPKNIRDD